MLVSEVRPRLAFVLWSGRTVGGAETFTVGLAGAMRKLGARPHVIFVDVPGAMAARLERLGVDYSALGLAPGARICTAPRRFASRLEEVGADGAIVVSAGYLAAAARFGGYRRPLVAVEHGSILQHQRLGLLRRMIRDVDRRTGVGSVDVQVAVSDFILNAVLRHPHAQRVVRIYNGLDLEQFRAVPPPPSDGALIVGCGGRLIHGKGFDDLIRAAARVKNHRVIVRVAGVGPELERLQHLALSEGLHESVEFLGLVSDMHAFWAGCHVAAVPSHQWVESFGMVACEAMATGRAVIATRNGALPELVDETCCGRLVAPGDTQGLADAIVGYADHDTVRHEGSAARVRCEVEFDLRKTARAYMSLFKTAEVR